MARLSVLYQNVRGLKTKTDKLYLSSMQLDHQIIALSESWLTDDINSNELFPSNYCVFRRDRSSGASAKQRGGGVLIATLNTLNVVRRSAWETSAEDLWLSIYLSEEEVLHVCCAYLPPGEDLSFKVFLENLNNVIITHVQDDCCLILCDANVPTVRWCNIPSEKYLQSSCPSDRRSVELIDTMAQCSLFQFNGVSNKNSRYLDLVLSNRTCVDSVLHFPDPLVPEDDHHPSLDILVTISAQKFMRNKVENRLDFSKVDYDSVNNYLTDVNWQLEFAGRTVDEQVCKFYSILNKLIAEKVPVKRSKDNSFPSWYSKNTIKTIKEKLKWHKKWKTFKNKNDYQEFSNLRVKSKSLINEDHAKFINNIESKISSDPKHIWSYLKSKTKNSVYPSEMQYNNQTASTSVDICNLFAEYFKSVYVDSQATGSATFTAGAGIDFSTLQISKKTVEDVLKSIDASKGPGPDQIPPCFVKMCFQSLSTPLTMIFNSSLKGGTFPEVWKTSTIIPIPKNDDRSKITNYRPIAILNTFGKVFEKIVAKHLSFDLKSVISPFQHGFVSGRSTTTNLINFTDFVTLTMDHGYQVDAVYTDFTKAFDKLDHSILIQKLLGVGVSGSMLRWFDSYIRNRSNLVYVNGTYSSSYVSTSGVAQGSHLGPLLFTIFINDIGDCFKSSNYLLYADDLKVFCKISTSEDCLTLQNDLVSLHEYCELNKLLLNFEKCQTITFTRNVNVVKFEYNINKNKLKSVNTIKDLGVILDSKFVFDAHIDCICRRARKMLGFLMRSSSCFQTKQTFFSLYFGYVYSIINYCSPVWNPFYNIYIERIERIQQKFLAFVNFKLHDAERDSPYVDLCRIYKVLPLSSRRSISDVVQLYKILNCHNDCIDLLSGINLNVPQRDLRSTRLFSSVIPRTNIYLNSPTIRMITTYNKSFSDIDLWRYALPTFKKLIFKKCVGETQA